MLKIFLLVPEKSARFMNKSSVYFITSLYYGEDDDPLSEQKEIENNKQPILRAN